MSEGAVNEPFFLFSICLSDNCYLFNGIINFHNCRYMSNENPKIYHEIHTQHPKKINLRAVVL